MGHEGELSMRVLPRLLLASVILSATCFAALPQASPPPGVPSPDEKWKLPDRDAMNANTVTIITAHSAFESAEPWSAF